MAQKNLRFGGLKNARNFPKFLQSKNIMKTGKSTSAIRFRVLPPFFRAAKKCHDEASAKADKTAHHTDSTVTSEKAQGPVAPQESPATSGAPAPAPSPTAYLNYATDAYPKKDKELPVDSEFKAYPHDGGIASNAVCNGHGGKVAFPANRPQR
jgi:hypothetical protein